MKHKIIIIFSSIFACSGFETPFNYLTNTGKYNIVSFPVKSIDMYQDIQLEIKNAYQYSRICHILINNGLNDKKIDMVDTVKHMFSDAILNTTSICIGHQGLSGVIKMFEMLPFKMFRNVLRKVDFILPFALTPLILNIIDSFDKLKKLKVSYIPDYLYDIGEYAQWIAYLDKNMYFVFDNRDDFFAFYTDTKALSSNNSNINDKYNFPEWLDGFNRRSIYIYLAITKAKGNWNRKLSTFERIWNTVNTTNKKKLLGHN